MRSRSPSSAIEVARTGLLALVLCASGCEPPRSGTDPPAAVSASARAPVSAAPTPTTTGASQLRLRALSAGYGGVGPATPAPNPNVWIVLFIEIEATTTLTGVAVTEVELLDATGARLARAAAPLSLRRDTVAEADRRKTDFAEQGTVPFDGQVTAGQSLRLRVHAPLDTRLEVMMPAPVRFRARFHAVGDAGTIVEGPLQGPWPTG